MNHICNTRCADGWHAMVMYSTVDEPGPGHFDVHFPGSVTEHERAMEAPLHPSLTEGGYGPPADWHAYVVRWRTA